MSPQFTDDDIGKSVVNANGDEVGLIADVEHGTAHVEPDPGITDTIKAKLGWGGSDEDTYPLQEGSVARVTDDEVRLERDLSGSAGGGATSAGGTSDLDTDRDDDSLIGDDDNRRSDDDGLIGDDNDRRSDDDGLIGDDNDRHSDDDGLIGDDDNDDSLIGDDNDRRSDDDSLLGDDNDRDSDDDDRIGNDTR